MSEIKPSPNGGNFDLKRSYWIAIALVVIIVVGGAGVYLFMRPPPISNLIVMGTTDSIETVLDPARAYDYFGWSMIGALGSGLVDIDPGSTAAPDDIIPSLASSWTVSGAGTIYDFTLKQGLIFADGTPFNSTVVKYTFDRCCNLTGDGIYHEEGFQRGIGLADIIDNVTITGEYTVRFYLTIPWAPFLQTMAAQGCFIVHPNYAPMGELVNYTAGNARASYAVGLGPYLLQSWSRTGGTDEEIVLVRNPNYWDAANGIPMTDTFIIKFYETDTALATAMTAGEIDVAYRQLSATQINAFRANPNVRVWEAAGPFIQYMCFQQEIYPFNETLIRRGIAAALNRTNLVNTVFLGTAQPLYTIIPDGMAYHKPSFEIHGEANYTYTQTVFDLFGYNASNKLVIEMYYESSGHYPQSAEQAAVYKSDLEASGVMTVNLNGLEWASYRSARSAGTMPVYVYGWYPDYIDPDNYAFLPFAEWLNMGYNATYPAGGVQQYNLWVWGRSNTSDSGRQTSYYALQDLQAQECSAIPLYQGGAYAVSKTTIHGIILDITINFRHWLIYWGAPATTGPFLALQTNEVSVIRYPGKFDN
ncbi:MAG: ABC transporter substrate-binding protein [Candidatus Thorarchaeota archaeon]